jgi:hypothetical protein
MIVFDLACPASHVFEVWFASSADYEDQRGRGLLSCPLCGSAEIGKAPMAPAVQGKNRDTVAGPDPKQLLAALAAAQAKALERSTWVGRRFAEEARSMHLGETEARPIHGQATPNQARALADEGVPIAPLPLPIAPPDEAN